MAKIGKVTEPTTLIGILISGIGSLIAVTVIFVWVPFVWIAILLYPLTGIDLFKMLSDFTSP